MSTVDTRRLPGGEWTVVAYDKFMHGSPHWYKLFFLASLCVNPLLVTQFGGFVTGWAVLGQFIVTLVMIRSCNALLPGAVLLAQAWLMGLVSLEAVNTEVMANMPIILLVLFVVTGVSFLGDFLDYVFTNIVVKVKSKMKLAVLFAVMSAFLSTLLDALTVTAVLITVWVLVFTAYHRFASNKKHHEGHDPARDDAVHEHHKEDLEQFRSFLRGVMMHAAVGTMLGGIFTLVGEPQNLLIGSVMDWDFVEFIKRMSPVAVPVFGAGIFTCYVLEKIKWSDFGTELPDNVRYVIETEAKERAEKRTKRQWWSIIVQASAAVLLSVMLIVHIGEIYIVGMFLIGYVAILDGKTSEHDVHKAAEGLAFALLLGVFFGIVAMVHAQHLFAPVTGLVFGLDGTWRLVAYFGSAGALSAISDNVFVASLNISEMRMYFDQAKITREEFEKLAVAINMGTNIPSIATPNGQAAFLLLLMSPLSELIKLSYGRMVVLAFPYAVVLTIVGATAIWLQY